MNCLSYMPNRTIHTTAKKTYTIGAGQKKPSRLNPLNAFRGMKLKRKAKRGVFMNSVDHLELSLKKAGVNIGQNRFKRARIESESPTIALEKTIRSVRAEIRETTIWLTKLTLNSLGIRDPIKRKKVLEVQIAAEGTNENNVRLKRDTDMQKLLGEEGAGDFVQTSDRLLRQLAKSAENEYKEMIGAKQTGLFKAGTSKLAIEQVHALVSSIMQPRRRRTNHIEPLLAEQTTRVDELAADILVEGLDLSQLQLRSPYVKRVLLKTIPVTAARAGTAEQVLASVQNNLGVTKENARIIVHDFIQTRQVINQETNVKFQQLMSNRVHN